ncbi:hypothetical protein AA0111_g3842 [Alternaria arborescens]|nr:hypothetical protein AA0111_g3842 [Alternaria arborescens]RYO33623.1 hypothetical protein AA0111_g3842 [Alternaria arborescens]
MGIMQSGEIKTGFGMLPNCVVGGVRAGKSRKPMANTTSAP